MIDRQITNFGGWNHRAVCRGISKDHERDFYQSYFSSYNKSEIFKLITWIWSLWSLPRLVQNFFCHVLEICTMHFSQLNNQNPTVLKPGFHNMSLILFILVLFTVSQILCHSRLDSLIKCSSDNDFSRPNVIIR